MMNSEIYKFAVQIGCDSWELAGDKQTHSALPKRLDQVGKLVAQECVKITMDELKDLDGSQLDDYTRGCTDTALKIADKINLLFGIND